MAINFPTSPTTNQIYTSNSKSWIFTGVGWKGYANNPTLVNPTIIDDTTTNANRYLIFSSVTSGNASILNTDSTGLTFNPNTGQINATTFSGTSNNSIYWGGRPLPTAGAVPGANGISRADASGYSFFNYINSNTSSAENPTIGNVIVTNNTDNNYYRKSTPANLYTESWSSWYAAQVVHGQLGSYAFLGYAAASVTAITAGTNQAGSGLRFWGYHGAVNAAVVSTGAVGATPSGTWKPMGTETLTTSLVKHTLWVRVA